MSLEEAEEGFAVAFESDNSTDRVVVEDEGKTCYAYYIRDGEIAGYVWLFNRIPAPKIPEWDLPDAREHLPFANSEADTVPNPLSVSDPDQIRVLFGEHEAAIYFNGHIHAIVGPGDKPGRCLNAAVDNAVAHRLLLPVDLGVSAEGQDPDLP